MHLIDSTFSAIHPMFSVPFPPSLPLSLSLIFFCETETGMKDTWVLQGNCNRERKDGS